MTHFGIPIESYFPWYTYTTDESMPVINDELRKKFTMALPSEYSPLMYVWIVERGYNNEEFIRNRVLVEEENMKYFRTPLGFMDSRTISVDFNKKIGYLLLKEDIIDIVLKYESPEYGDYGRAISGGYWYVECCYFELDHTFEQRERDSKISLLLGDNINFDIFNI